MVLRPVRVESTVWRAFFDTTRDSEFVRRGVAEENAERAVGSVCRLIWHGFIPQRNTPVPIPKLPCDGLGFCWILSLGK
jgi:hypothetical protein